MSAKSPLGIHCFSSSGAVSANAVPKPGLIFFSRARSPKSSQNLQVGHVERAFSCLILPIGPSPGISTAGIASRLAPFQNRFRLGAPPAGNSASGFSDPDSITLRGPVQATRTSDGKSLSLQDFSEDPPAELWRQAPSGGGVFERRCRCEGI